MKRVLGTLMILAAGAVPAMAQSMLKVSLTDRRPITVSVDGRHFKRVGESVTVNDLPKGRHYVIVYVTETLKDGRQADGVIWEGNVKTYRGQLSLCMVDPRNREANITEQDMYSTPRDEGQQYNNYNLNNYDSKPAEQDPYAAQPNTQPNTTQDNTSQDNNLTPVPDGSPVASPVGDYNEAELLKNDKKGDVVKPTKGSKKIEQEKKKISEKATDTDKLAAAKDLLKSTSMTTTDVMAVMDCFAFDNTKVEFAEWAYYKTTDKGNFKQVKQKLSMKEYKDEIDKFLKR